MSIGEECDEESERPSRSSSASPVSSVSAPPPLSRPAFTPDPLTAPSPASTSVQTDQQNSHNHAIKCAVCRKRMARERCLDGACLACCTIEACPAHKKAREQAEFRALVMAGDAPAQRLLKQIRSKALPRHRFREKAFAHAGDTVTVWDVRQFFFREDAALERHRDDAVRKSRKRRQRQEHRAFADPGGALRRDAGEPPGTTPEAAATPLPPHKRPRHGTTRRTERFRRMLQERLQKCPAPPPPDLHCPADEG